MIPGAAVGQEEAPAAEITWPVETASGPGLSNRTVRSKRDPAELSGDVRRGISAATIGQGGQVDRSAAGRDDVRALLRDIDNEHSRRGPNETHGGEERQPE